MRSCTHAGLVALLVAAGIDAAEAQTIRTIECEPMFRLAVGITETADENGGRRSFPAKRSGRAPDISAGFELPIDQRHALRAGVGTVEWPFQSEGFFGVPTVRDRVRLTRAVLSVLRRDDRPCGAPIRMHAGGGIGGYRYEFQEAEASRLRFGVHALAGLDVTASERIVITADVTLQAVGGPDMRPVASEVLLNLGVSIGAALTF